MKYNAPYGVSDPNAAYINGNPSTGTMGSIPPAASIEYPQREIVEVIAASGLVPDNADLQQLARGIQNGGMNYQSAGGTPNSISINLSPVPLQYYTGMMVILKAASTPTDQTQLNVNNLGGKPIVGVDGNPISVGAWQANYILVLVYDDTAGGRWVLVSQSAMVIGGATTSTKLTAPRDYYVNGTTGNDANDGAAAVASSSSTGPFKTIQKGVNVVGTVDLNGYTATVNVANGTYPESVLLSSVTQNGAALLKGNRATPSAVVINPVQASAIITAQPNSNWMLQGLKVQGKAAPGDAGNGIWSTATGRNLSIWDMEFGQCDAAHMLALGGAIVILGAVTVSGWAQSHIIAVATGTVGTDAAHPLTLQANPNFTTAFIQAASCASTSCIFSITGTATGPKFLATANGVISSVGNGPSYYPGSSPGSTNTGGQYI